MTLLQALVLGLVQGLTEFIPVSSSGHLVLLHRLFGVADSGLAFDVALHAGTLIALLLYFRKELFRLFIALFRKSEQTRLAYWLVAATLPAATIGYLLESAAESRFRSARLVSLTLLLFGLVMLLAEYYYQKSRKHPRLEAVSGKQAMSMGLAQAAAIIPGVSRSGSTITAGLFAGLDRVAATRFSFLLGIPITAGAVIKVFAESGTLNSIAAGKSVFLTGALTALVSSLFAIRFMLRFLAGHDLKIFAYYRIVLGISVLLILSLS